MKEAQSILPFVIIIITALASFPIYLSRKKENLREFWTFLAAFIQLSLVLSMLGSILNGSIIQWEVLEVLPNVPILFRVDGLGILFAIVAAVLWIPTSMYSIGYMRSLKEANQTQYFICFTLALSATIGVAFSGNLFTLYMFYELLSLSTYPLVTHNQDKEARIGGRKYLVYLLGTSVGFALPAMILTYHLTGTLEFSQMGVFGSNLNLGTLAVVLLLFLFGFSKAGIMPFHGWLPGAMVAPTPVSSLLHAVAVVKVGVFSIVRVVTGIFGLSTINGTFLSTMICIIAGITVITSSLIALSQDSLKRRLAFSTVGQLSYIILAVGLANKVAVVGAMVHIVMHAFGKITLFYCTGAIYLATGEKYISKMKGIGKKMPIIMFVFFIGALCVTGIPPSGGLVSKWLMLTGALEADKVWVMIIYLGSTILNAAYFLPIVYNAFFVSSNDTYSGEVKPLSMWVTLPPIMTATSCVLLFFFPEVWIALARMFVGWI